MRVASQCLCVGGRLVFWLPVPTGDFGVEDLIECDGMKLEWYPL